jgi:hypothetical protein
MAARKATRDFAQVTWGVMVPTSSIDGQRESVIPETAYPPRGISAEQRAPIVIDLYKQYRAGPAERLSGVERMHSATTACHGMLRAGCCAHKPATAPATPDYLLFASERRALTPGHRADWVGRRHACGAAVGERRSRWS